MMRLAPAPPPLALSLHLIVLVVMISPVGPVFSSLFHIFCCIVRVHLRFTTSYVLRSRFQIIFPMFSIFDKSNILVSQRFQLHPNFEITQYPNVIMDAHNQIK
jgi:hypothetical protein